MSEVEREDKPLCLSCKYEPDWSEYSDGLVYSKCSGRCKYVINMPPMPAVFSLRMYSIERFRDNSGIPTRCNTWEPKV
jgi:hypothetical protein